MAGSCLHCCPSSQTIHARLHGTSANSNQHAFIHLTKRSVKPDVYDGTTEYIKVSSQDLVPQLRALGLGTSSQLYTWDPAQETFRLTGRKKGSVPKLTIEGYDEVTTDR
jgi:hypothetical protein